MAFFVWEPVWGIDAWVALTAVAMRTERIRLGTMLTPLPRRLPWELAGQVATLDNLSGGRVILPIGLGAPDDRWWLFEDDPGRRMRAERMDEALDLMQALWSGEPVTLRRSALPRPARRPACVPPPPVQRPRVPIWVVGAWPRPKSMRRAARLDGWLPAHIPKGLGDQEHDARGAARRDRVAARAARGRRARRWTATTSWPRARRRPTRRPRRAIVRPWIDAGATWWIDADWSDMDPDRVRAAALAPAAGRAARLRRIRAWTSTPTWPGSTTPARASRPPRRSPRLHRAHMLAVPFENLDLHLGRRNVLDPDHDLRQDRARPPRRLVLRAERHLRPAARARSASRSRATPRRSS